MKRNWLPRHEWSRVAVVLSGLIVVAVPLAQFYFRQLDNNSVTSWHLIFLTTPPRNLYLVLLAGAASALVLSWVRLPLSSALLLFLACFASTTLFWSAPEVGVSASRYVTQAKHLELYGMSYFFKEWGHAIQAWMDMPAIPFFDGLIFKIFGESRISIQLFTAILFGMTSVVTLLIGRELWDEETGLSAGLLLLGIPYLVIQTPLMLLDVHTMFFLTLAIYLYIRAVDAGGTARTLAASLAVFIAAFCKYSVWPMLSILPVISIFFFFQKEGDARRQVLMVSLRAFFLLLLFIGVPVLLKFDVVASQIKLLFDFERSSLGRWTETWTSIFFFQTNPVITIAAAFSLFLAVWKRDDKYLLIVWLPFLTLFFHLTRVRYMLPIFPMLTLMAARGLVALQYTKLKKIIIASVVATTLATCFFLYLPFLKQWSAVNLKDAGQFLDTLDVDAVEVIAVPQQNYPVNPAVAVPLLDLFTHKRIFYHYVSGTSTPDEDYHISRFRDSWEYQNPPYYESGADTFAGTKAIAVILAKVSENLPPELSDAVEKLPHSKSFTVANPFFYNHTIVRIYW